MSFHVSLLFNKCFKCLCSGLLKTGFCKNFHVCFYTTANWIDTSVTGCSSYEILYDYHYDECCYELF